MRVLKFGGTSVASAEQIKKVVAILENYPPNNGLVVVVSALGGATDVLLQAAIFAAGKDERYKEVITALEKRHLDTVKDLIPIAKQSSPLSEVKQTFNTIEELCDSVFRLNELPLRTKDQILAYGELLSSRIVSAHLNAVGKKHAWVDARRVIRTNHNFGNATVDHAVTNKLIQDHRQTANDPIWLVPGFIGGNADGQTTTLGRGGSDFTAAIFAAALDAEALEIWTDVDGMMTADPRWVVNARNVSHISYQEAMELSHFGAKVIYPPTIQPVMSRNIPVWIKNTFNPSTGGTLIERKSTHEHDVIKGITSIGKLALLSLEGSGMIGVPGFSKRLFEALASERINVVLITQNSSEYSICVAVNETDAMNAKEVVDAAFEYEIAAGKVEPLKVETGLSILALVGDQMRNHPGISGKMFSTLGRNGINVRAIAQGSSERNISSVIATADVKKAVTALHEAFFEFAYKRVNVFIAGAGNVGSMLISQIAEQNEYLKKNLRLKLNVTGIANSKKMLFDADGVQPGNWKQQLDNAEPMQAFEFVASIVRMNLPNSVFVDVTANAELASLYHILLAKSISVVACNKIAAASDYTYYQQLKTLSSEFNAPFLFETNVGAGLPVIGTLNDLLRSGDSITKIEAVLSGTLNYVFNNYNATRPFGEIVAQAQAEGYTEPDPRLDLTGTDVARKILILARESGQQLELSDVSNTGFLPQSCLKGDVNDFYNELKQHEDHFRKLYNDAESKNCKLKFVASFQNSSASVGLQHIAPGHEFYNLHGKDNIVLFYTHRYADQPLVVKGAGAGAAVTASGVFADILRTVRD